ncbi:WD40 repeat-like protein [Venustampulla echinocandica]|uniref:WD40 repeat-like protein n=1 Tax=Venustampulla echinocandica TaxID=2656787 RepID=A0A370TW18_9HELO|nr:WD40 repeat-like protein [Venustampulla echinocandica]RDL39709.1 WD40 repeat-like protein [Venustampulla echinocandica]
MSSTPMAIDSPIGPSARANTGAPSNGIPNTSKVSDVISLFRPTKLFRRDPSAKDAGRAHSTHAPILSIDFSDEGDFLLTSESDNSMQIYDVHKGKHHKTCLSQKYGVMHAMFTHKTKDSAPCIIHSSTKLNRKPTSKITASEADVLLDTIRYLSTHDNSYLRYFEGHEKNVTCLSLHPGQDNFLSCSEDNTVRIWDAGTKNACGKLHLNGGYLAAWDPSGNVFAVASPTSQSILLYDYRNFDREPFSTFDVLQHSQEINPSSISKGWNKLEFSNDGKHLLLGTTGQGHLLLDAFDGHLKAVLRRERGGARRLGVGDHNPDHIDRHSSEFLYPSTGDCCFTPDGRYVISGARRENVLVWDTLSPAPDKLLRPAHELEYTGDSGVIAFNPKYNMFATGDKEVVFWVPDMNLA